MAFMMDRFGIVYNRFLLRPLPLNSHLLFNNGAPSLSHPIGTASGITRTFSAVSKYRIDESAKTATEIWTFENDQKILSLYCSSVYEGPAVIPPFLRGGKSRS
jgi:hypothetical protein